MSHPALADRGPLKCSACNSQVPSDAAFCTECGRPVAIVATTEPAAPPAAMRTVSGLETMAPGQIGAGAATLTLEPGTLFADRYVVERKLGEGGMGVVYVAKDNNTGEDIVLKLIHPKLVSGESAMKRLVAEGVTARQIRHPNIVAVYDVAQLNGQPYLTMELVKGGTLRTWMVNAIKSGRETKLETAIGIIKSILAGLAEAHRMGVVHRDLKPENILLCGDPALGDFALKILDFGIARAVDRPSMPSGSSGSGGSVGTPLYMAPEQKTAADTVGPAADLYSVAVMLYELLMEALPQGRWEPPSEHRPDVPKAIDAVIEKGMMTRARSRFQSAAEYVTALDHAVLNHAPTSKQKTDERTQAGDEKKPEWQDKSTWSWGGWGGEKGRSWRLIAGTVGGTILVLAIIGSFMEDAPIGPGSGPNPPPNSQSGQVVPKPDPNPPPESRQAFNASGTWYDDVGTPFAVSHDGNSFTATGSVAAWGPIRITGNLSSSYFAFQVTSSVTGTWLFSGSGNLESDGRHLSYVLNDSNGAQFFQGRFHINHLPGS